jgi:hypothetical protein
VAAALAPGCRSPNDRPPARIGGIEVYRDATAAIALRLTLLDDRGRPTVSDGTLEVAVYQLRSEWSPLAGRSVGLREPLALLVREIHRTDFVTVQIGAGQFRHETVLYNVGRLAYADFTHRPSESRGLVVLVFHTPDARTLRAEQELLF